MATPFITNAQADQKISDALQNFDGGTSKINFQPEITTENTTFTGTQKGEFKVFPFNTGIAQTVLIQKDSYVKNDIINIERRGAGTLEIVQDDGVRFRGVRDSDNRFFVNDENTMICLICRGDNEFSIFGNLKRGSLGVVSITSYTPLKETEIEKEVTVVGENFTENMIVSVNANATLNSWIFVSKNEIILNLTTTGSVNDIVSVTYDNGDIFIHNALVIGAFGVDYLFDLFPFENGWALGKLNSNIIYPVRIRRSNDDAETDVEFDENGKVSLASNLSVGGTLSTWIGTNDAFITIAYDQGSFGFHYRQTNKIKQPKLISAGALIVQDLQTMIDFDGSNDELITNEDYNWAQNSYTVFVKARLKTSQNTTLFGSNSTKPLVSLKTNSGIFQFLSFDETGSSVINSSASILNNTNYRIAAHKNSNISQEIYVNSLGSGSPLAPNYTENINTAKIGSGNLPNLSSFLNGYESYCVFYKSDQSANIASIETILSDSV